MSEYEIHNKYAYRNHDGSYHYNCGTALEF